MTGRSQEGAKEISATSRQRFVGSAARPVVQIIYTFDLADNDAVVGKRIFCRANSDGRSAGRR